MNVYDKAHELSKALKTSNEYKSLQLAKQALDADETAKKMVKDFFTKKIEMESLAFLGKDNNEDQEVNEKLEQLKNIHNLISLNSKANAYVNAYMRLTQLMNDLYKIIGESFSEIIGKDMFE